MKKHFAVIALLGLWGQASYAQSLLKGNSLPIKNTYQILASDSPNELIRKAAHVVPTKNQYDALKDEFISFIHFGPNTFTRMEWGNGKEDPRIFDLKNLDTDQWCESMKAAGMTKVIFTAKHHDGFVLWQSRYTDHGIMSTGFMEGKGDIMKELAASCRKYGLKLGVYLSPADLFQIENEKGLYGNLSSYTMRTIPRKVEGRPFANKTSFQFEVDDYNEYFLNQLFELLTEYGPIHEVWFDGAHPKTKGGQKYNYPAWRELIHKLAPEAIVFGKEDLRWCGNEAGATRSTEWNIIPFDSDPHQLANHKDLTGKDLGSREKLQGAKFLHYQPAETNTSIREGWFYRDDTYQKVRSTDDVFDIYERSVGGNSIFLLNIPPNREGRFSPEDVRVLKEIGERISKTYGKNLLSLSKGPKELFDDDPKSSFVFSSQTSEVEFTAKKPITINRFMLQEAIQTNGERIEKHAIDAWLNGKWEEIAVSTNVGYKRILRFPEVTAQKFRLRILESRALPVISSLGAYYAENRPPQLEINRGTDGKIKIAAKKHEFGWKPHGQDAAKNLNADYQIFYTVDGSEPTTKSLVYEGGFPSTAKIVKAIAIAKDGLKGSVVEREIGFSKADWSVVELSSFEEKHPGNLMFDEDEKSFWKSKGGNEGHFVVLDLGKVEDIKAFSYTPQKQNGNGMLAKGNILLSEDGKKWVKGGSFEFGNLINDPSTRMYRLEKVVRGRFVKLEAKEIAGGDDSLSIAELDVF